MVNNIINSRSIIAVSVYPYCPDGVLSINKRAYIITPIQPHNGRLIHSETKGLFASIITVCDAATGELPDKIKRLISELTVLQAQVAPDLSNISGVYGLLTETHMDSIFTCIAPTVPFDTLLDLRDVSNNKRLELFDRDSRNETTEIDRLKLKHYNATFRNEWNTPVDMIVYGSDGNALEFEYELNFSDIQLPEKCSYEKGLVSLTEQVSGYHKSLILNASFDAFGCDNDITSVNYLYNDHDAALDSYNVAASSGKEVIVIDGVVQCSSVSYCKVGDVLISENAQWFIDFANNTINIGAGGFELPIVNKLDLFAVTGYQLTR
ncbi:hypothetical protein [Photobacterium aquimaris]|uniref:Uncharacterized protein n=1 Tax=Photobacterium aquimaris TaxID=512643 RepID=A0A2T3HWR4_9GAMM|nr:hypothetical protein [Photobacterium aquimaris]OBU21855.1 hypothetical protein AYY21_16085 [Photobacterium aquimaris]PQJ37175.1 hypothetical protein BTN98_18715 [Photobacterium aquimaris]PSU03481.1 hypothetical protein C0W81_11985 [Photobacterium aquimaris]